ncbi:MAG: monovalent cation/H+ antiporter complex subunit F [Planctomycetota bacterium]|nr:monovalent cation/H+ antiporter complex subunit F [Planctomycetota bacterium]
MSPLDYLLLGLFVAAVLCLWRVVSGPTPADRTVGVDILGVLMVGFCAVLTVKTGKDLYMIVGLAWSLLAFVGALALAKHLEGKRYHD